MTDDEIDAAARDALQAMAGGPRSSRPPITEPVSDPVLGRALQYAYVMGADGLVADAVARGFLATTPEQHRLVAQHHERAMRHALRVEQRLLAVCRELDARGVGYRLLKGVALAHQLYADPARRAFGDADLLVEPGALEAAVDTMVALGGHRQLPELRRGYDARFGKDVAVILDGVAFDLHRTLVSGAFGERIPVHTLFDRHTTVSIGDAALSTMEMTDHHVHAGLTAGAADVPARLTTLRDLLEMQSATDLDGPLIVERAAEWGVRAPLARATRLTDSLFVPSAPSMISQWARTYRPTGRESLLLRCYTSRRTYLRPASTILALGSWSERRDFLASNVWPQPAFRVRRGSRLSKLRPPRRGRR